MRREPEGRGSFEGRGSVARPRRGIGPRGLVVAAALWATLLMPACAAREPHARMSRGEIQDRVESEFPIGTPRDAVLTRLRRDRATFDAPLPLERPAGWSTLRLYFDQPWWAGLEWSTTYRKTEAWTDLLFDEGQSLREIKSEVRERTW